MKNTDSMSGNKVYKSVYGLTVFMFLIQNQNLRIIIQGLNQMVPGVDFENHSSAYDTVFFYLSIVFTWGSDEIMSQR